MSAVIVFAEEDSWFINSRNWSVILERIMVAAQPADRHSFDWFLNETGLHFPSVEAVDRNSVARMVLSVLEELQVELSVKDELGVVASGPCYGDLVSKLRNEINVNPGDAV
ncbi:hypothetical protein PV336_16710 [Streptomyces sp. MI02-2A]|jgi:hypothetical protein|uniref:hypothetical protein n=1 Tax=unclassified Streptomyces TaxID=2593676 RepID=UPI000E36B311|nr:MULTISPECIES: hypothetical protein [unclassified Streptomyces]MDX3260860.1 hypothetical protein [Streptomyces sp. MI02-2A]REE63995.1 hypothetical protein BX257_6658 [Streptomyces sp. 3212.3]